MYTIYITTYLHNIISTFNMFLTYYIQVVYYYVYKIYQCVMKPNKQIEVEINKTHMRISLEVL